MSWAFIVVSGLFLIVYGPLTILAWRRPLLARLALRETVRRRGQSALLVVGLLIGSVSITAAMVGADSGNDSRLLDTYRRWGAVDLTVSSGDRFFPADVAGRLAADPRLKPYVAGVQGGVELLGSVADLDQRLSRAEVLVVGFDSASQGPFGAFRLSDGRSTYGDDLATGQVLLSQQLASALDARRGDRLRITAGLPGDGTDLRVAGIATPRGPGAYSRPMAVFMPLTTARLVTAGAGINIVRVSARGTQPGSVEAARRAAGPLRSAVARLEVASPLRVGEVKVADVASAENATQSFSVELAAMTSLIVVAGIALMVNLMLALAEERRPRLAILRALGLTRPGLIALSILEGAIYSLAAATVGIVVGVLAGWQLAVQIVRSFSSDPDFRLVLSVQPATLATAFAIGSLITLTTVAVAAHRTSRLSLAAAIRDLPEPAVPAAPVWRRRIIVALLGVLGAAAVLGPDALLRLGGGVALIAACAVVSGGRLPDRARATTTGLLLAAWAASVLAANRKADDLMRFIPVLGLGVLMIVVGLCIASAANLELVEAGLARAGGRFGQLQAALRPPIAYLSRRPLRTGLATSAFALVLVLVTILAVFVSAYRPAYARDSAGYDIRVISVAPNAIQLPPEVEREVTARATIPMRRYTGPFQSPPYGPNGDPISIVFYGLSDDQLDDPPIYVGSRDSRFASTADLWQAIRRDPGLVVLGSATPGGQVTLLGTNGPLHLVVAGSPSGQILDGAVVSAAALDKIDTEPAGSTLLLKTRPGVDPRVVARQIERAGFSQGVQATAVRDLLDQGYVADLSWITFFDVLLHMGLLVGVLSLAVVGIRAAVERRRAIGVMRALGYQRPRLLAGLVAEAALTATIGVAIGVAAGAITGFVVMRVFLAGTTFGIDTGRMGVALAIVYGTALIVTAALAWRAAQIRPADSIRHTG